MKRKGFTLPINPVIEKACVDLAAECRRLGFPMPSDETMRKWREEEAEGYPATVWKGFDMDKIRSLT